MHRLMARQVCQCKLPLGWHSSTRTPARDSPTDTAEFAEADFGTGLGASATPMNYGEVYSGLQTGIIDGAENNPPSLWTSNHYEVAKYYSLDEHSRVPEVLIMSKKVWDGLSPNDQKLIAQAAQESVVEHKKLWNEFVQKSMDELRAHGTVFVKPDKSPFQKAVQPVYAKYPEYKELISQIQAVK